MNPQMNSLRQVRELATAELSLKTRLGYVALLLAAAGMTAVVASLWLTEPVLPVRTHGAFGVMCLIGVSWVALAIWALSARRPLFARDRVVAGSMAVAFTSVFAAAAGIVMALTGAAAAMGAFGAGVAMLALAVRLRSGARRHHAALLARRAALEA